MAEGALALRVKGLRKRYGKIQALDGLDLSVPRGSIFGLIGPNGAGKTTTFGIIGGFIRPDAGEIDILGLGPFDPDAHPGRLTLLPQDAELSPHTSVRSLLVFYAELQGLTALVASREADRVLEAVALSDRAQSRIGDLSHGMRRRVAVAQALLGEPELVLLDEPVSGLDPELVVRMRDLFASQRGQRTLVISSHDLSELEAVCDHVSIVRNGRAVRAGSVANLLTQAKPRLRYVLEAPVEVSLEPLSASLDGNVLVVEGEPGMTPADVNQRALPALLAAGARVIEVRAGQSLEAAYMESKR
jgi:ABC-type multidrug transport system ATPase subunit